MCGVVLVAEATPGYSWGCVWHRHSVHRRAERRSEDLTRVALFSRPSEDDTGALLMGLNVELQCDVV